MNGLVSSESRYARLVVAILSVWVLSACAATFQPTPEGLGATDETRPFDLSELFSEEGTVTIDGTIVELLESFPPQLVVDSTRGRFTVQLDADTPVRSGTESASLADLSTGVQVRLTLQEAEISPQVLEVEILDAP